MTYEKILPFVKEMCQPQVSVQMLPPFRKIAAFYVLSKQFSSGSLNRIVKSLQKSYFELASFNNNARYLQCF